jgi:hypothetical protein
MVIRFSLAIVRCSMAKDDTTKETATPSSEAPPPSPGFTIRLLRRVIYMAVAGCFSGAILGRLFHGLPGVVVWGSAGAVLGAFLGLILGGYAWVLESPLKGAIRGGGLLGATMGLLLLIGLLAKEGWGGFANAVNVALVSAGAGAVAGAALGAFLAWLAGPIFREIVQEADRGDSPFKRRRWW